MKTLAISSRTICGIEELPAHSETGVTHVLSIIDPGHPDIHHFEAFSKHLRTTLRFHDIIDPLPGQIMPAKEHVGAILAFGDQLDKGAVEGTAGHLLVHCHMGISRSTAAMVTLMAQGDPTAGEEELFERLRQIRSKAWPNSVMIAYADEKLGRGGRLVEALRRHYGHQLKHKPEYGQWMRELKRGREVEMALPA
ncbi:MULTISPECIES: tyrosine phosphatase family protein [unclassified Aureimonas]|uniref:tyrosine phosphatase family protein n=1 Tax=unclassified Aureimonas TaxID=2615206 RepID=UPI0007213BED|nr:MULTISPECIES: hypothetical protein [unclassified Aureimonas]ALN75477.1 hypothetical protein M673_22305 [Aureimonas sp. AU20]